MDRLHSILTNNPRLPSPPVIAVKILEAVKKDESSFSEFAQIIASDPALTAKILKVSNSSFYSRTSKITTIDRALSMLGMVLLKNLALSFVITKDFNREAVEGDFKFELFWRRAITAAVASELVTALIGQKNDDAFVSAILQDIGIIVMYYSKPDDYQMVLDEKRTTGLPVDQIERNIFGFDHQELGSELLKLWGLPEEIYQPIRYHHAAMEAPAEYQTQAAILGLSDQIAGVYHGMRSIGIMQNVKKWLGDQYGIEEQKTEAMIDAVARRSLEIFTSFEIEPGDMKPFSQILQEANEELSRLNLSYEQLVMEYKQARDEAEQLAFELKVANDRLRELAIRDGLTGLYNHRHFQEVMDIELERAYRDGHPMTLILFDIDNFKKVNDTYGHPRGDTALKAISATLEKVIRPSDFAARYGGEEFALVMPKTGLQGEIAIIAERLRTTIENLSVNADGSIIRTTISIGVASYSPKEGRIDKAQIIAAADKALFTSKRMGKNRFTLADPIA